MKRPRPDRSDDALGFLLFLFVGAVLSMGLALCQAAAVPQGFAP